MSLPISQCLKPAWMLWLAADQPREDTPNVCRVSLRFPGVSVASDVREKCPRTNRDFQFAAKTASKRSF